MVYTSNCMKCKEAGKTVQYIGETSRSIAERNKEHQEDSVNSSKRSHITEHVLAAHPESLSKMTDLFVMRGVKAAKVLYPGR